LKRIQLTSLSFLVLSFAVSCAKAEVSGFEWKDASGARMPFTQSSSWPAGEEGRFDGDRLGNRYILKRPLSLDATEAVQVLIARALPKAPSSAGPAIIKLFITAESNGSGVAAEASFPLLEDEAYLIVGIDSKVSVACLAVESEKGASPFEIRSVEVVPAFRGIESGRGRFRVSSNFTLAKGDGYSEFTIKKPFPGAARATGGNRPGILLEYGKPSKPAAMRINVRLRDGSERSYKLRSHPSGTRTALDESVVPVDAEVLTLRVPDGVEVKDFYATRLGDSDYRLADLGRVINAEGPISNYELYRWDMLPAVLVFDFKDYATQDRYLKRIAFFVEKIGYRGVLAGDETISALHGWNAHDYRAEDLAAFFQAVRDRNFPIDAEERELEGVLLDSGILRDAGGKLSAGTGAMISISRESSDYLRWTFAVHESTHGVFFADPEYRSFVRKLWSSVGPDEKWFWKTYLGWAAYDIGSDYLIGNEFQAYLLQQPKDKAEEYFSKRKADELLEKHEELRPRVEEYMKKYGKSFADRAGQLESWLYAKYGIEAGRTIFLTPER
jgi:hypothetical protein